MIRFAFFVLTTTLALVSCRSSPPSPSKSHVLKPHDVSVGATCSTDADCGYGGWCYTSAPEGGAPNPDAGFPDGGGPIQYCVPQQGEGGPCTANNQCLSGICCNAFYDPAVCLGPGCF